MHHKETFQPDHRAYGLRREIFTIEDELMAKRDSLIDALEKRLSQQSETVTLFTIHWKVT